MYGGNGGDTRQQRIHKAARQAYEFLIDALDHDADEVSMAVLLIVANEHVHHPDGTHFTATWVAKV